MKTAFHLVPVMLVISAQSAWAQIAVPKSVLSSGGGVVASLKANYVITATVGQGIAGPTSSANLIIASGFWTRSPTEVPTDVPLPQPDTNPPYNEPVDLPRVYKLYQNYPNPFNPATAIHYDLPRATKVKLWICDTKGRLVRTLVTTVEGPGRKSVVWNGVDNSGRQVASGIYIYVLETTEYRSRKRLVLVR